METHLTLDALVQALLDDTENFDDYCALLREQPDEDVRTFNEQLKQEIDRQHGKDPRVALELANRLIGIGWIRQDLGTIALGMMARGDALQIQGSVQEAWDTLRLAGRLYLAAGDRVGWARTRIGRVPAGFQLHRISQVIRESQIAHTIFERAGELNRALRLDMNLGYLYESMGAYQEALQLQEDTLRAAENLAEGSEYFIGRLTTNIGWAYIELGQLRHARAYHERSYAHSRNLGEAAAIAASQNNLAYIALLEGRYTDALNRLLEVEALDAERIPIFHADARRLRVKCYLALNRYTEARDLARQVIDAYSRQQIQQSVGYALIDLATAEAELGCFEAAQDTLDQAEAIFTYTHSQTWIATIQLRRAQVAVLQGNAELAEREAGRAAAYFEDQNEPVSYASARLLLGQLALSRGDLEEADASARAALAMIQRGHLPWLSYNCLLLLGQVAEARADAARALRRYRAASRTIERVQRSLTITLRAGYLEGRQDAQHGLMRLYLREGQAARAFETLERTKSQVLLNHLANRENLRWLRGDARSSALIQQLEDLRTDHYGYYQLAYNRSLRDGTSPEQREQALRALEGCEKQMRALVEQLYLQNGPARLPMAQSVMLPDIQQQLNDDSLLLEFYNDGHALWVFLVDAEHMAVRQLPMNAAAFDAALRQLQFDIDCALKLCAHKGPLSPEARGLVAGTQRRLRSLYDGLLGPLAPDLRGRERLFIVPYGSLHYLPFHLLYDGECYLAERVETVVVPAAGLLTAPPPVRPPGALLLAHHWGGRLPKVLHEAQMAGRILDGAIYYNEAATRQRLVDPPRQVLHIAAHGQYRMDQPELSYVELADGQLFTDDLLQHDLSYELVTLSACETGRATVAPGDELIGLGRGFLYAGAGALITSLWRIDDNLTLELMQVLYHALQSGASKAAALREAQLCLSAEMPGLHPAFWGAFQLVGRPDPLSTSIRKPSGGGNESATTRLPSAVSEEECQL
jgi:CHAT domain-containing protein